MEDFGAKRPRRGSSDSPSDTLSITEPQPEAKRSRMQPLLPSVSVQRAIAGGDSRMLNGNVHRDNIHGSVHTTINHYNALTPQAVHVGAPDVPSNAQTSSCLYQDEKDELVKRLRFPQLDGRLQNLRQEQKNTCVWIKKRKDYKAWLNSDSLEPNDGFFWIKGNPGTGKSIAMKFLYQSQLRVRGGKLVISFFFNARGNNFEKSVLGMYRSLLYNLFDNEPSLRDALDHCQRSGYHNILEKGWSLEVLKAVFAEAVRLLCHGSRRVYCFIDALDECPIPEIRDMISFFERLVGSTGSRFFRVCFSSRHYPQVFLKTKLTMTMEKERSHTNDIETYINSRLEADVDVDPERLDKLKAQILLKSSGIFLWVTLVVHQLNELGIESDRMDIVVQHLHDIPRAAKETPAPGEVIPLYGLFEDVIKKDSRGIDDFVRLAQIIFRAKRPLTREEFYIVLEQRYDTSFELNPPSAETMEKRVLRTSKGLAEVTRSDKPTVQFIHETVMDFFRENGLRTIFPERTAVDGHEILKESCLQQLGAPLAENIKPLADYKASPENGCRGVTGRGTSAQANRITTEQHKDFNDQAKIKFPFLEYASQNLLFHADEAQKLGIPQQRFIDSFPSARWIPIHNLFEKYNTRRYQGAGTAILYILARNGYNDLIKLIPNCGEDCVSTVTGEEYPSALVCAIYAGHLDTAYTMTGLDPTDVCQRTVTPTKAHFANMKTSSTVEILARVGDLQLLRKVLENGDHRGEYIYLTKVASEEVLDLLVEFSILPDFCAENDEREGQEKSLLRTNLPFIRHALDQIPSLLKRPVWGGRMILHFAASKGFTNLLDIYFEHDGGGGDKLDDYLLFAAGRRDPNMVRDALFRGANVNTQDEHGRTALHRVARIYQNIDDHNQILDLLLSQDSVDWQIRDHNGLVFADMESPYKENRPSFIKRLISAPGADPSSLIKCNSCRDQHHRVSLLTAALFCGDDLQVAKVWTDWISNPQCKLDVRDSLGRTTLSWCFTPEHLPHYISSQAGRCGTDLLRSLQVDVNSRDDTGHTILEHSIRYPCPTSDSADVTTFVDTFFQSEELDPNLDTSDGQHPLELIMSFYEQQSADWAGYMAIHNEVPVPLRKLSTHLIKASRLLLDTNKVHLEIQRRCQVLAPPEIGDIIRESMGCHVEADFSSPGA